MQLVKNLSKTLLFPWIKRYYSLVINLQFAYISSDRSRRITLSDAFTLLILRIIIYSDRSYPFVQGASFKYLLTRHRHVPLFIQLSIRILERIDAYKQSFCSAIIRNTSAFGFQCELHFVRDLRFCELLPHIVLLCYRANFSRWCQWILLHYSIASPAHFVLLAIISPIRYCAQISTDVPP